ncbi:hypothetical protein BDP27DRAFT_1216539 [Rhodocollybia butyracea]|uniref:Glycopeptide n=1 Tax=Rhodocollybia butyracea TaxID=206335 RepID=A0A9P5Q1I5_9AGAR|nr:hypothetical protein BDP27DRAFT_1216539 [Rhodocollybia butyracea]
MQLTTSFVALASLFAFAAAESHTVTFTNNCGSGTPTLVSQNGSILSTGQKFTSNGPLNGALAYLQSGTQCGLNGDSCTTVETTLKNPTTPGGGSGTDITLVPPHKFSVTSGFQYTNGCSGGETCSSANCPGAFTNATNGKIVSCQTDNVGVTINLILACPLC